MTPRLLPFLFLCFFLLLSCGKKSDSDLAEKNAVVALSGDVENFNPVVTSSMVSSEVNSSIYPIMFDVSFDLREGQLVYEPGLVRKWEFENNGLDVRLYLQCGVRWEDGQPVTPHDVKFSYSLYGDPDVASPRSNYVESMIFTDGRFDVDKSITIVDDSTMVFHFSKKYPHQLFHLNLSPIPRHVYRNADRKTLRANPENDKPLSAGPFRLESWTRQQGLLLASNPKCIIPHPGILDRVTMKIISEPTTRLTELKTGKVDIMWPVYPEDVKEIQNSNMDVKLVTQPPRAYEYVGWANIDFEEYRRTEGKVIRPHRLFGDMHVRQALTYAINRKAIIDAKLGNYGELAVSDISPIFRWALNNDLIPYSYDPEKGRELLRVVGWEDTDGDGILDKNGMPFEFTLYYNTGNARREYAATVIQENLKLIGIRVNLATVENVVFYANIAQKKYDAFIAGMNVSLSIDPSNRWGDIRNPFNNTGFQHRRVTELLKLGLHAGTNQEAARFWREIQAILHQEQPCTFMYWIKSIVGVNRRLKDTKVNALGVLDGMWDWKIGDPNAQSTY